MNLASIPLFLSGSNDVAIPYLVILSLTLCYIAFLQRRRAATWSLFRHSFLLYASVSLAMACALQTNVFHAFQLISYALFLYGPVFFLLCAWSARKRMKVVTRASTCTAILLLGLGIDAFFIEPHALEVTHYQITTSKLQTPIRVAVASDIQTDDFGEYERHALNKIAETKPDLVLLPGDYLQSWTSDEQKVEEKKMRTVLNGLKMNPCFGIFAVRGDAELDDNWISYFTGTKVKPFEKTTYFHDGAIDVTALSFNDSCNTKLHVSKTKKFHIVFGHRPDFALGDVQADLMIAGHTHGGQVQIPFLGPIITLSNVPRSWAKGALIALDENRNVMITRGVGLERYNAPRLRFMCRPEVVIIDVLPRKK